jgi:integrative and conjugative element protein (TIGR02256 family)
MSQLTAWVTARAVDEMIEEALRMHPLETGGMLLGWSNPDLHECTAVTAIGPGPAAQHHKARFCPDAQWQQAQLERVYAHTSGKVSYLGDWHVHPAGGFTLSRLDRKTMRAIAADGESRCPQPLMGLLAPAETGGYIFGVWSWKERRWPALLGEAIPLRVRKWEPQAAECFWELTTSGKLVSRESRASKH